MSTRALPSSALSRRRFLKTSVVTAGALVLPLASKRAPAAVSLKPVTITLDWLYQGPNAGFLLAQEKGFYRDAGLDAALPLAKVPPVLLN